MSLNSKKSQFILLILMLALGTLPFLQSLKSDFVKFQDPIYTYNNAYVKSFSLAQAASSLVEQKYQPVTITSLALDNFLFGFNPLYFHLHNLLLHLLNIVLVFYLIYKLSDSNIFVTTGTSVLFALHPMQVESVMWIAQRQNLLAVFFSLLALHSYLLFINRNTRGYQFLSLIAFSFALLSSFNSIALPVSILLLGLLQQEPRRKVILNLIPYIAIAGLLSIVHLNSSVSSETDSLSLSFLNILKIPLDALAFYISKLIVPLQLSPFYQVKVAAASYFDYLVLLLFIGVLFYAYTNAKKIKSSLLFGLLFFAANLLPFLSFSGDSAKPVFSDHAIYLASIGLFFFITMLVNYVSYFRIAEKVLYSGLAIIVGLFAILSYQQSLIWSNNEVLWRSALEVYPDSSVALNNLGEESFSQNKVEDAESLFRRSLENNPVSAEAKTNLAKILMSRGEVIEAESLLNDAKELKPNADIYYNLGVLQEKKDPNQAISNYTKALSLDPDLDSAQLNLSNVYKKNGDSTRAEVFLLKLAAKDTKIPLVYNNLGLIAMQKNNFKSALIHFKKAEELDPLYEEAIRNMATAYVHLGLGKEALKEASKADLIKTKKN